MSCAEVLFCKEWFELALVGERGGLRENVAVVGAAVAGKKREQCEDSRIGGRAERERSECVGAPAKATDDMTGVAFDGDERSVEDGAAESVIDDVEAFACRVLMRRSQRRRYCGRWRWRRELQRCVCLSAETVVKTFAPCARAICTAA